MKKLFLAFALVACFAVSALSQGAPPWTIQEVDGSPRVNSPTLIKVTNGTLSCTGKTCTITISGGGGGSPGGSSTQVQYNAAGSFGGISGFTSDGTNVTAGSGNLRATRPRFITSIDDTNGNEVFVITATGSAVNEFTIANAATGNNPTITASGGDANVGINFIPKGSGTIQVSGVPIVTTTATQTLTNKTLTAPVISTISNTGTLTLPTSTDTLVARATTDTLTNKTYDTAGTGNVFRINGTQITDIAGDTGVVATVTGATSNGNCAEWDANGNLQDSGAACGGGGGGGSSGANPTASVGLSAVNGVATTFMRSDAAPPLSQSITPTWTGQHIWSLSDAAAVAIGPNGNTNPVFRVVTNVASAATGVSITGNAAGSGVAITVLTSGATENLNLVAVGAGGRVVVPSNTTTNPGISFSGATGTGFGQAFNSRLYGFINNTRVYGYNSSTTSFGISNSAMYAFESDIAGGTPETRIINPATGVIRVGGNSSTNAGSLIIGTSAGAIGTSGAGVLAFTLSTEPSTSPTDTTQLYYKDFTAGDGRLYLRNEASAAGSPVANLGDAQTFTGRITFSPGGTIAGINVGSVAGDPSTPSNGDLWYDSSSNELTARINGANVALGSGGGGGGITIGTTTITSGTNTRVLYNNSGVVGEYAITGTGNVVMSASPTLTGTVAMAAATASGTIVQTSASSAAFESGPNGSTNPVFRLVNNVASAASGVSITGRADGTAPTVQTISRTQQTASVAGNGLEVRADDAVAGSSTAGAAAGGVLTLQSGAAARLTSGNANGGNINLVTGTGIGTGTAGQVVVPDGVAGAPGLTFSSSSGANGYGLRQVGGNQIYVSGGGVDVFGVISTGRVGVASTALFTFSSTTNAGGTAGITLRRAADANLAFGAADAASPVAQTLSVQNVVGGTTNTAGVNWTFAASRGTGTGAGGDIIFQTAPAGGSGTTQNTLATAFTIQDDGAVQLKSVTFANLPTVANGYLIYCSDCTIASPCASGGSGALAKGINGAWVCN